MDAARLISTRWVSILLVAVLVISAVPQPSSAYYDVDMPRSEIHQITYVPSGLVTFQSSAFGSDQAKRYLVFGHGPASEVSQVATKMIYGLDTGHGSFSVGMFDPNAVASLRLDGYTVIQDLPLEFDSSVTGSAPRDVSRIDDILGSSSVISQYNYTGEGIKIGIVDTGTDFSNPDMSTSLARDNDNVPIMVDADGQGIVLTNSTFVAQISNTGVIQNYTHPIPKNATSSVYVNSQGVFLDLSRGGKGTTIPVYNSQYPKGGTVVINGTVSSDYKIGRDARHFIVSKSGIYHFGMAYESVSQDKLSLLQLVPVLVVDSKIPGVYDTIIPDMADSYKDFVRITSPTPPTYDYDFTTQKPIRLGGGNEYLVYDKNGDGTPDYSAGTVGARVLDLYGVFSHQARVDKMVGAVNGTLLPPLDPHGNFFGVMYDYEGHGTATAGSITSQGVQHYDVYGNSTSYVIRGVAPGAKIVPIKALWLGDALYGWLWAAGFDQAGQGWKYSGSPRVDILSNSWGISTFPALGAAPGMDVGSLLLSALNVPGSLDPKFPGILTVSSSGNAGPGYGTIGSPDAAPFGLTVGAATDNIFVGYGPFKGQPRFGNSTSSFGDVSGFSSKGPTLVGDPKPDIMGVGEYGFTPSSVTRYNKNSTGPFSLFGGTSLAAPLTAGSAAIVMQAMRENDIQYNPFMIKNILMSSADDLGNDPFAQGSGLVNVTSAVDYVLGRDGAFAVHNNATYTNTVQVLQPAISSLNSSEFGLGTFRLDNSSIPVTPWFAGRLLPGERTTAAFTIENPTGSTLDVSVEPEKLGLVGMAQYNGTTEPRMHDPLVKKKDVYRPDYIPLDEVENHASLLSYFQKSAPIPADTSLMVVDLSFPFSEFMNSSAKAYAGDIKISSLYVYDWDNRNGTQPQYRDLSLINREGSWGTVQEVRISHPDKRFDHMPLVGVYPVPTRYSYWSGDTKMNSTAMNYTVTASYFARHPWRDVWVDSGSIEVRPHGSATVLATLVVPTSRAPGVYEGYLTFHDKLHSVNVPVSYVVLKKLQPKDLPTVIRGSGGSTLFGSGFVGGGFDMSNRYNAGDWRQYYFDVTDKTINSATVILSWRDPSTNLSVFVVDPRGNIVQTNVPPGVLGQFQGWPSGDWLGPSAPFGEGGGFYPVKNRDATSTEVYAPINQTGVYSVLVHTTLFGGESVAEPVTLMAKFSTILPTESPPLIDLDLPQFINSTYKIIPRVTGENLQSAEYSIDSSRPAAIGPDTFPNATASLAEGQHDLMITASDSVGHIVSHDYRFTVDNTPPQVLVESPANGSTVSGVVNVSINVRDADLPDREWLEVALPDNRTLLDNSTFRLDTSHLQNGPHFMVVSARDSASNSATERIEFIVDNSALGQIAGGGDQNFITLGEILAGIAIAAAISVITFKKFRISQTS